MTDRLPSVKLALLAIDRLFPNCTIVLDDYMSGLEKQEDQIRAIVLPLRRCGTWDHCPECQVCPHEWACRWLDGEELESVLEDHRKRISEELVEEAAQGATKEDSPADR